MMWGELGLRASKGVEKEYDDGSINAMNRSWGSFSRQSLDINTYHESKTKGE